MNIGGVKITSGFSPIDNRTNWTGTQIRGSEKKTVVGSWFGAILPAVLFGLFFWHTHLGFFISKNVPNPFLCVFIPVSFFMFGKAIWETIRLKRFGDPLLELNTAPIPLGGTVEGRITLTSGADNAPEFTVTLACIHHVHTSGSKSSNISEKVLWSAENKTSLLLGGILPISVAVPADQPQTNCANPFDCILWRLTVKAPFRGQAFLEKYEIPVGQAPSPAL
jgi:hypothetical protein